MSWLVSWNLTVLALNKSITGKRVMGEASFCRNGRTQTPARNRCYVQFQKKKKKKKKKKVVPYILIKLLH